MKRQGQLTVKFDPGDISFSSLQNFCHPAKALRQRQSVFVVSERAQEFSDLLRPASGGTNHFQGFGMRHRPPLNRLEKQAFKFPAVLWPGIVNTTPTSIKGRARLQKSPPLARHPC